jgi:hypothetical protein
LSDAAEEILMRKPCNVLNPRGRKMLGYGHITHQVVQIRTT